MLEAGLDSQLASFIKLTRMKYLSTDQEYKPIDFGRAVQYFTLDSITRVAYGHEFGYLDGDTDAYDYIKTTEEVVQLLALAADWPLIRRIFMSPWMLKLTGPSLKDKTGMGKLMAFVWPCRGVNII